MNFKIQHFGQIEKADITVGDLTLFVGPQASGKSIALQLFKLLNDAPVVVKTLREYGLDWKRTAKIFFELYFGDGMGSLLQPNSRVYLDKLSVNFADILKTNGKAAKESVFYIPAQRVLAIQKGWPRPFRDWDTLDPFVVKNFSEQLNQLMQPKPGKEAGKIIFPQSGRMKRAFREQLIQHIFHEGQVELEERDYQQRLILSVGDTRLQYMAWSAGQREFMPLLLGLYWLMPPAKAPKKKEIEYVIIEEPEMGLHPTAIESLMLLVLELIQRGYKVLVSTHSPVVLDVVWAIQHIKQQGASPELLLKLFGLPQNSAAKKVLESVLEKTFRTYYFHRNMQGVVVEDISSLDAGDLNPAISGWGGLTEFSSRAAEIVAESVNHQPAL